MEDLSKESILKKISIKDILIVLLIVLLAGMTFCGSPIDRKKSEIKDLHEQNDSLSDDIRKKDVLYKSLEVEMEKMKNNQTILEVKIKTLNDSIKTINDEKNKKKGTIRGLDADGVVDFFTEHLAN